MTKNWVDLQILTDRGDSVPKFLHPLSIIKTRKSVLHRWMLTYFLVLLIPLALSGYSYFASYRIIEREVQTSNATSLKLMSSTLDQQVETASNIGNQLLSEQRLKQFRPPKTTAASIRRS